MAVGFGDTVRILESPETLEKGVSGLIGSVYGETTPSATSVEVIGDDLSDFALNVHFEELEGEFWFVPELVEFVDHGVGQSITLDGVDKEWVRSETGEWLERGTVRETKRWWKFW